MCAHQQVPVVQYVLYNIVYDDECVENRRNTNNYESPWKRNAVVYVRPFIPTDSETGLRRASVRNSLGILYSSVGGGTHLWILQHNMQLTNNRLVIIIIITTSYSIPTV